MATFYYTTYADLPAATARDVALTNLRDYIGQDMFDNLDALLREAMRTGEILCYRRFSLVLFMLPVSGFPVRAWYDTICADMDILSID